MEFVYEKFFILVDRENGVVAKLVCCQWILFTLLVVQCILFYCIYEDIVRSETSCCFYQRDYEDSEAVKVNRVCECVGVSRVSCKT